MTNKNSWHPVYVSSMGSPAQEQVWEHSDREALPHATSHLTLVAHGMMSFSCLCSHNIGLLKMGVRCLWKDAFHLYFVFLSSAYVIWDMCIPKYCIIKQLLKEFLVLEWTGYCSVLQNTVVLLCALVLHFNANDKSFFSSSKHVFIHENVLVFHCYSIQSIVCIINVIVSNYVITANTCNQWL